MQVLGFKPEERYKISRRVSAVRAGPDQLGKLYNWCWQKDNNDKVLRRNSCTFYFYLCATFSVQMRWRASTVILASASAVLCSESVPVPAHCQCRCRNKACPVHTTRPEINKQSFVESGPFYAFPPRPGSRLGTTPAVLVHVQCHNIRLKIKETQATRFR